MAVVIMSIILYWIVKTVRNVSERKRIEAARKAKAEAKWRSAMEKEQRRLQAEQTRQEKEQIRLAKEQARQAAQLAKHEKRIADLEYRIEQAEEDIDNLAWRIEEQQKYSVFLQEQRDKCSDGSAEYFKWQNKLTAVDNKVYQLDRQMHKAIHARDMARREMEVA